MAMWTDPTQQARAAHRAWADATWSAVRRACGDAGGAYAAHIDVHRRSTRAAAEEVALAYSDALARLRALKDKVDPANLFRSSWPRFLRGRSWC